MYPPWRWSSSVRGSPGVSFELRSGSWRSMAPNSIYTGWKPDASVISAATSNAWYVEGMMIEVTSLYCVVAGIEVVLRTSAARAFDPAGSQTSSSPDVSEWLRVLFGFCFGSGRQKLQVGHRWWDLWSCLYKGADRIDAFVAYKWLLTSRAGHIHVSKPLDTSIQSIITQLGWKFSDRMQHAMGPIHFWGL